MGQVSSLPQAGGGGPLREYARLWGTEKTMVTYTIDTHATIRELEEAGMDSRQAEVVVAAISRSDSELATKADLKAEITTVRANIDKLEISTKADIANLKAEVFRALWIQGAGIVGIQLAIAGLLFAALKLF